MLSAEYLVPYLVVTNCKYIALFSEKRVFFVIAIYSTLKVQHYIGTLNRISRPLVLPKVFSSKASWDHWIFHLENVARVNGWDNTACLHWLKVWLIGRAPGKIRVS